MRRFSQSALLGLGTALTLSVTACSGDDPPPLVPEIVITTEALPAGQQGEAYSATLSATGGSGAGYKWSVPTSNLPNGIFISSQGEGDASAITTSLSGRPTVNGRFTFTVSLTDASGKTGTKELTIELAEPPPGVEIVADALPEGSIQNVYTAQVTAMGGTPEYRWTLASGALPPGLNFTTEGTPATTITGQPTDFGSFDFTLRVSDATGTRSEASFTIVIQNNFIPLSLLTTDLPDGSVGVDYTADIVANNGEMPYQWRLFGEVPAGLEITREGSPGVLSGTPTVRGNYTLQIEVEDGTGTRIRRPYFLDIGRRPPPLRITTLGLPGAEQNVAYTANITAVNGSGAGYSWAITQGSLPAGLTLASGTPDATISGTPTGTGTSDFTLQVVDDAGNTFEQPLQIVVQAEILPLQITTNSTIATIFFPRGEVGAVYSSSVTATGGFGRYNWVVTEGTLPTGLSLLVAGTPETVVAGTAGETGTFTGTITVYDDRNVTASKPFTITIDAPANPVVINTAAVAGAGLCEPYNATLSAQDGSNVGYTWTIVNGTLPPGLALQAAGTPDTVISGLAGRGTAGSYPITVQVTDSNGGMDTVALTVVVTDNGNGLGFAGILGDLTLDNRTDLYGVDLCSPLPTTSVRLNTSVTALQDIFTGTDDVAVTPDGSKIAYIGEDTLDGSSQVYVVTVTNGIPAAPIRVSGAGWTTDNDAFGVRFSPDGNRLAFVGDGTTNSVNEMYIVDTSGVIVADSAVTVNPAPLAGSDVSTSFNTYQFSSDSQRLVFVWDGVVDNEFNLYVADVSTIVAGVAVPSFVLPANGDVGTSQVVPVPGSSRFLVAGDIFVDNDSEIGMVDATTLPPTTVRVNAPFGAQSGLADVQAFTNDFGTSENGAYAWYFADARIDGIIEPFSVNLTTPGTAVALAPGVTGTFMSEGRVVPGGTGVLMLGDLAIDGKTELFIFDLAGTANQPLATARVNGALQVQGDIAGSADYAVSPDGTWVAYTADQVTDGHDDAYVVPLVGLVPGTDVKVSPESTDINLDATQIAFSTDSSRVAFEGDLTTSNVTEAYVSDLFGPGPTAIRSVATPVTNGDVFDIFFASPTLLLIRGDVLVDNDTAGIAVDVSDPANQPSNIANETLVGLTDVSRIILP